MPSNIIKEEYEFEKLGWQKKLGGETETNTELLTFARRLGLDLKIKEDSKETHQEIIDRNFDEHTKILFQKFVTTVHLNIQYYVERHKFQRNLYWVYMGVTVVLLIVIPCLAYFMPMAALKTARSLNNTDSFPTGAIISAQLTALLAGIFGIHRVVSSWLFRRNSAHEFWKAGSELKTILYSFEERWLNKTQLGDSWDPLFIKGLIEGKKAAREIVKQERESFFKSFSQIAVDLQDVTEKSIAGAGIVVGKVAEPIIKQIAALEQKKANAIAEVQKARQTLVTSYAKERLLKKSIIQLEYHISKTKKESVKSDLNTQLTNKKASLDSLQFELIDNKAEYESKWAISMKATI